MNNLKYKYLFFDLDRTLWDFETNSQLTLDMLYHKYGLDQKTEHFIQFHEVYKKINGKLWELYAKNKISKEELRSQRFIQTLETLHIPDVKLADKLDREYLARSPYQTQLFPHTKETLEILKSQGYRMSIITNGFAEVQTIKLKNSGIDTYFEHVICSEQVGFSKPDKKVFEYAMNRSKAKNIDSIMIGDDINGDVLGAESAGIRGVLFDENPKKNYTSDITRIHDLSELPMLILRM